MSESLGNSSTWRTTHGDLTDEEWALIADLVAPYSGDGRMGRPVKNDRRVVVDAIFYVCATGASGAPFPLAIRTETRYTATTSRGRATAPGRGCVIDCGRWCAKREGREALPSAGVIDARSVRATATAPTRG